MKSGKGLLFISAIAGIFSWILNEFFKGFVFSGSGRTLMDHPINISPEEYFYRVIHSRQTIESWYALPKIRRFEDSTIWLPKAPAP